MRLLAALTLVALGPLAASAQGIPAWVRTDARALSGTWAGVYECAQGRTGLALDVRGDANGGMAASFSFFPVAENPSVSAGSYEMAGALYADGRIVLVGTFWKVRPADYVMVDFDGWAEADGQTLRGTVCGFPLTLQR